MRDDSMSGAAEGDLRRRVAPAAITFTFTGLGVACWSVARLCTVLGQAGIQTRAAARRRLGPVREAWSQTALDSSFTSASRQGLCENATAHRRRIPHQ